MGKWLIFTGLDGAAGKGENLKCRRGEPERPEFGLTDITAPKAAAVLGFSQTGLKVRRDADAEGRGIVVGEEVRNAFTGGGIGGGRR